MFRFAVLVGLTFLTLLAVPAHATAQGGSSEVTLSEQKIADLVKTLENEGKRQEFIDNLKSLNEAQDQINDQNTPELAIDLGIDKATNGIVDRYEEFLANNGLREGLVGQIALTAIIIFFQFVGLWIVRRLSHILRDRVNKIRDRYRLRHDRFRIYARYIRYIGYIIVTTLMIYSIGIVWDFADTNIAIGDASRKFLIAFSNVFIVIGTAIALWEIVNTTIESYLLDISGPRASRMRTVVPIAKNVIFVVFAILFALVLLSEIGVNVFPLLAGAGVVGIAVGFGAQTMVKDFLTGFTIILEDLIQVGDVVKLGDRMGLIERITIRKVQLRDVAGIVYTVPFSEIKIVENWTKDFSYYVFDVSIAYRENTDEVVTHLKTVDEELRADDNFKDLILSPLEILGVDRFADSAVVIKARIKTLPVKQWDVGREFNRRMKLKFDEHDIEIPFPHQTVYFGINKDGKAPAAPIELIADPKTKKSS